MKRGRCFMAMVTEMLDAVLDAERMLDKQSVLAYMNELFGFDVSNLDALYDALTEVSQECRFILTREHIKAIVNDDYAYKILLLISGAVQHNPYLSIAFQ